MRQNYDSLKYWIDFSLIFVNFLTRIDCWALMKIKLGGGGLRKKSLVQKVNIRIIKHQNITDKQLLSDYIPKFLICILFNLLMWDLTCIYFSLPVLPCRSNDKLCEILSIELKLSLNQSSSNFLEYL
jgi:hypothetical protein